MSDIAKSVNVSVLVEDNRNSNGQHQIIAFLLALYVMVTYIARYNVEKTSELGSKYFRGIANIAP